MKATEPLLATAIEPTPAELVIRLDGDTVRMPWNRCSRKLAEATEAERLCAKLSPGGYGIHWPLIDEDLTVAGLVERAG